MIVRTYQRRAAKTNNDNTSNNNSNAWEVSLISSQEDGMQSNNNNYMLLSSQESSSCKIGESSLSLCTRTQSAGTTLMEAQESGEMMEHVDEANFALDGLRSAQPLRIQRASLLSLLSICTSIYHRRLLRTQGMVKRVIDAIVALSTDDSSSALISAALLYVLASDGQDEHFLDSGSCIQFLLKLLQPSLSEPVKKAESIGSKILGMSRNSSLSKASSLTLDSTKQAIISKVHLLLTSMKEIYPHTNSEWDKDHFCLEDLDSKWLALLTLEKACLTTVALEDTSGSVRRVGGDFKERLREFGGIDAICGVAVDCLGVLKEAVEEDSIDLSAGSVVKSRLVKNIGLLLKCMKVMENATFLSDENKKYLLEMSLKVFASEISFVAVIVKAVNMLSELVVKFRSQDHNPESLEEYAKAKFKDQESRKLGKSFVDSNDEVAVQSLKMSKRITKELSSTATHSACTDVSKDCKSYCSSDSSMNGLIGCNGAPNPSAIQPSYSRKVPNRKRNKAAFSLESVSGGSQSNNSLDNITYSSRRRSKVTMIEKENKGVCNDDSQDPYAFDCEDLTSMNGKIADRYELPKTCSSLNKGAVFKFDGKEKPQVYETIKFIDELVETKGEAENDVERSTCRQSSNIISGKQKDKPNFQDPPKNSTCRLEKGKDDLGYADSQKIDKSVLLGDCLLAAIKVLMNLTNDNPLGSHQVAVCGGLDTMATLIVAHYPNLLYNVIATNNKIKKNGVSESAENGSDNTDYESDASNMESDLLVAVLGVLVNIVEKDMANRARLAALSVKLPDQSEKGSKVKACRRGIIPLLCSIFLAKHGAGEALQGEMLLTIESNDEAAIQQGQREAENMIVEAYSALLLGFLSTESENARRSIACCLPCQSLMPLVPVLERFVAFHLSLNMLSSETHTAVSEVIESCKRAI